MRSRGIRILLPVLLGLSAGQAQAQWLSCGAPIHVGPGDQFPFASVPDGAGGAVVIWVDESVYPQYCVFAQRLTHDGLIGTGWPAGGTQLGTTCANITHVAGVEDGSSGALVTWTGSNTARGVIQRVTSAGALAPGWPAAGVRLSTQAGGREDNTVIVTDGAGGAIVAWSTGDPKVFAQRITAAGTIAPGWPPAGDTLTFPPRTGINHTIVSDGAGGALIAWTDFRNTPTTGYDIYAQRIGPDGKIVAGWPAGGAPVCTAPGDQGYYAPLASVTDGAGGMIVVYPDGNPLGSAVHLFAQRITAAGSLAPGWPGAGVPLCQSYCDPPSNAPNLSAVSDGFGGVIVAWMDWRTNTQTHVYAQHIRGDGTLAPGWPADGLGLCTAAGSEGYPYSTSDGAGGAVVAWYDARGAACCPQNIYALRVTGDGQIPPGWMVNGTPVCVGYHNSPAPIVPDGTGGAIIPWSSSRSPSTGYDVYALRLDGSGSTVDVPIRDERPDGGLRLLPALPNPGRGRTTVRFELASSARVVVDILTPNGRRVRRLADGLERVAGPHSIPWDGRDEAGASVPSGIYFVSARAGAWSTSGRLILLR